MSRSRQDDAYSRDAGAASAKETERRRLAQALRANLGRRKDQRRARLDNAVAPEASAEALSARLDLPAEHRH